MFDVTPIYSEVWTVEQSQEKLWNAFLKENGIDIEYFKKVLSANQAAQIQFGSVDAMQKEGAMEKPLKKPTLLWRNASVEVYMPGEPRVINHLAVVLKRSVKALTDVTEEESIELRSVIKKIQQILRTEFGTPSLIVQWNKAQPRQLPGRCTIEVIPTRPESAQVFDVCDRAECSKYYLWQGRFSSSLAVPTEEEIKNSSSYWKTALQAEAPPFSKLPFSEPLMPRSILWTKKTETIKALRDPIFEILQEKFKIRRENTRAEIQIPDQLVCDPISCTFCNQKILDAEKVYETDLSYVLLNHKSPVMGAHFLIFPKRHVRSSEDLREDELKEQHGLVCRLIRFLEEEGHTSEVLLYTQDDPAVAQKVPHTHTHVMRMPEALKLLLFTMNYDNEPVMCKEKMQELVLRMRERLSEVVEKAS